MGPEAWLRRMRKAQSSLGLHWVPSLGLHGHCPHAQRAGSRVWSPPPPLSSCAIYTCATPRASRLGLLLTSIRLLSRYSVFSLITLSSIRVFSPTVFSLVTPSLSHQYVPQPIWMAVRTCMDWSRWRSIPRSTAHGCVRTCMDWSRCQSSSPC